MRDSSESGIEVEVLRDQESLGCVHSFWQRRCRHPNASPGLYHSVLLRRPYVESPWVLRLSRGGETTGLVVGRLERRSISARLGYARLASCSGRSLTVIQGGTIGQFDTESAQLAAKALAAPLSSREIDTLFISSADLCDPVAESVGRVLGSSIKRSISVQWRTQLPSSMDGFLQRFSRKRRHEFRRKLRQLEKRYKTVEVSRLGAPDEVGALIEAVEGIADASYHRRLGVGYLNSGEDRDRLDDLARRDCLRGFVLSLDGSAASYLVGGVHERCLYLDYMGFRREFSKSEPGTMLLLRAIESSIEEGIEAIDFGHGEASYKQRFGTERRKRQSLTAFAPTWRGRTLRAVYELNRLFGGTVAGLRRHRISGRLKTAWRGQLRR